jgi:hypothetical protein
MAAEAMSDGRPPCTDVKTTVGPAVGVSVGLRIGCGVPAFFAGALAAAVGVAVRGATVDMPAVVVDVTETLSGSAPPRGVPVGALVV